MKRLFLALTLTTPLLLSACNQNDTDKATAISSKPTSHSQIFNYVPADTPYLVANLERIPVDIINAYLNNTSPVLKTLQENLNEVQDEYSDMLAQLPSAETQLAEGEEPTLKINGFAPLNFFKSLLDQFTANPTAEGLANMGLRADTQAVIYGLGPYPVVRMEIADEGKLRAVLEKAFNSAGKIPQQKELDGRKYWQAGNDAGSIIVSIEANEMAMSLIPSNYLAAALPNILGLKKPARPLDVVQSLSQLNRENKYSGYGSGWIKTRGFVDLFLNNDSGAATSLRQLLEFDPATVSDVCKTEITAITDSFPRAHFGYQSMSTEQFVASSTLELSPAIAEQLQGLVIDKTISSNDPGGLVNLGFALNLAKTRDWILATAQQHIDAPYQCEQLTGLNEMFTQAYTNLNRPLPPFANNFIGFKLKIEEMDLNQLGQANPMPRHIKALFAVLTSNPEMLVGMGQMFIPELAGLDLTPGADPVPLALDGMPGPDEPTWAASSDSAIGIALGDDMNNQLQGFLNNGDSSSGEFLSVGIDGAFQAAMENMSENMVNAGGASTNSMSIPSLYERIFMNARFTDKGIVFKQVATIK